MVRLVLFLIAVGLLASGLAWLADRPGSVVLTWQGYEVETSVFRAVVILALVLGATVTLWSVLRQLWKSPGRIGLMIDKRRHQRGLEALSSGMIAIGAGDRSSATRYAVQARKALPDEPMTHLLRAQAAQLSGDRATARRIFEAMLAERDTEQLGLRGLYLEAEKEGEKEAARQFAERAFRLNPKLAWPFDALLDLQCRAGDWEAALATLSTGKKHGHIDRSVGERKRAVLLTALAQERDDSDPARAQTLALDAHKLALDLVPAAEIAARHLASRGQTGKAAKVLEATWKRSPHPSLATAYAYARPGDSPRDRLERVRTLVRQSSHTAEGPIALAIAALDAHAPDEAAKALEPLLAEQASQRVCTLMAKIEAERGNKGRVREWLARAVNAPRDPAWTADGIVSETWRPISPVTGALDAFRWKVPGEQLEARDLSLVASEAEHLIALGAAAETTSALEAPGTTGALPAVASATEGDLTQRSAMAAIQVAAAARAARMLAEAKPTPLAEAAAAAVVPMAAPSSQVPVAASAKAATTATHAATTGAATIGATAPPSLTPAEPARPATAVTAAASATAGVTAGAVVKPALEPPASTTPVRDASAVVATTERPGRSEMGAASVAAQAPTPSPEKGGGRPEAAATVGSAATLAGAVPAPARVVDMAAGTSEPKSGRDEGGATGLRAPTGNPDAGPFARNPFPGTATTISSPPGVGKAGEATGTRKPAEPKFYSPPRAPDDPGPEASEEGDPARPRVIART